MACNRCGLCCTWHELRCEHLLESNECAVYAERVDMMRIHLLNKEGQVVRGGRCMGPDNLAQLPILRATFDPTQCSELI